MTKMTEKNLVDTDSALVHVAAFREAAVAAISAPDSPSRLMTLIHKANAARLALEYLLYGVPLDASVKMDDSTDDCVVKGHDLYTSVKYLRQLAKEGFIASLTGPLPTHERSALGYISDRFVAAMNAGPPEKWIDPAGKVQAPPTHEPETNQATDVKALISEYEQAEKTRPWGAPKGQTPAFYAGWKQALESIRGQVRKSPDVWEWLSTHAKVAKDIRDAIKRGWGNEDAEPETVAANVLNILFAAGEEGFYKRTLADGRAREELETEFMKSTIKPIVEAFGLTPEQIAGEDRKPYVVEVGVGQMITTAPNSDMTPVDGEVALVRRTPKSFWFTHDPDEIAMGLDATPPEGQTVFYYEGWEAVRTFARCLHTIGAPSSRSWQAGFAAHMAYMPPNRPLSPSYGHPERLAYGEGFAARMAGVIVPAVHDGKASSWDGTERACPYGLNQPGNTTRRNAWFDGYNDAGE